jgi:hypothetical protein
MSIKLYITGNDDVSEGVYSCKDGLRDESDQSVETDADIQVQPELTNSLRGGILGRILRCYAHRHQKRDDGPYST